MLSKFTYTANIGRAAVTLDLLQVGVINAFSRQAGRITYSLYDDQKTHIFNFTYMSNTGNLTPMDKSTFRWFRWIHRTNVYSVG